MTERLFYADASPTEPLTAVGHLRARRLLEHRRERSRRDRQVERGVAADAVRLLELDQLRRQCIERLVVVERSRQEAQRVGDALPHFGAELGQGMLLCGFTRECFG